MYNRFLEHVSTTQSPVHAQRLVKKLFGRGLLFTRKTFGLARYMPVRPLRMDPRNVLRTYWSQGYHQRYADDPILSWEKEDPYLLEAVNEYDAILEADLKKSGQWGKDKSTVATEAAVLGLEMDLSPGDIQLVSNHFVMHARTAFEDYSKEEVASLNKEDSDVTPTENANAKEKIQRFGRRDLLRLWISHPDSELDWDLWWGKQREKVRVLLSLVEGVLFYR